jgi:hypothetical protein
MSSLSFSSIAEGLPSDLIHRIELADPSTSLGNDHSLLYSLLSNLLAKLSKYFSDQVYFTPAFAMRWKHCA